MAPNTASRNNQNGKVAAAAATANRVAKHIRENVIGTPKVKKLIDSAMNLVFFCLASIIFGIILIGSELATLCVCSGLNFWQERSKRQAATNGPASTTPTNNATNKSGKKGKKAKDNNHQGNNQENHEQQDANNHED